MMNLVICLQLDSYVSSTGSSLVVYEEGIENYGRTLTPDTAHKSFFVSYTNSLLIQWDSGAGMSSFSLLYKTGKLVMFSMILNFFLFLLSNCCMHLYNTFQNSKQGRSLSYTYTSIALDTRLLARAYWSSQIELSSPGIQKSRGGLIRGADTRADIFLSCPSS